MAKKSKGNRIQIILECTEHKTSGMPGTSRYVTQKNRKNTPERVELKKYNAVMKKMTVHFELRPMENPNLCLVNLDHHPRPKELIYSINCAQARLDHTSQWTVLNNNMDSFLSSTTSSSSAPNSVTLRLRKPACSTTRPCNVCQGECYSDAMCTGRLECVLLDGINPLSGCTGVGTAGKSYCHLPLLQ